MYEKNLSEDIRLRLSSKDYDFIKQLSSERCVSVSECIRSIIGEYRRSLENLSLLSKAINLVKEGEISDANFKADFND